MKLRKVVAYNVRKYRMKAGLTLESLAIPAKLHPNYVGLLERGGANISIDSLERISKILKIQAHVLLLPPPEKE